MSSFFPSFLHFSFLISVSVSVFCICLLSLFSVRHLTLSSCFYSFLSDPSCPTMASAGSCSVSASYRVTAFCLPVCSLSDLSVLSVLLFLFYGISSWQHLPHILFCFNSWFSIIAFICTTQPCCTDVLSLEGVSFCSFPSLFLLISACGYCVLFLLVIFHLDFSGLGIRMAMGWSLGQVALQTWSGTIPPCCASEQSCSVIVLPSGHAFSASLTLSYSDGGWRILTLILCPLFPHCHLSLSETVLAFQCDGFTFRRCIFAGLF